MNKIILSFLIFSLGMIANGWGTVHQIDIKDNLFCRAGTNICPARETIAVGDTVRWVNIGGSAHTSTSDAGVTYVWNSGTLVPAAIYICPFTQAGVFPYRCNFHGNQKDTLYVQQVCTAKPGDANGDNLILMSDIVTLINVLFKGQAAPNPVCRGDANGSGTIQLSDVVYLINLLFKSGPAPIKNNECCL